jgi:Replication-relaxation
MSAPVDDHGPLPGVALEMMASLYQHRLLSTKQLRALHTPEAAPHTSRRILAPLLRRGLIDRVRGPGTLSLWYLTEHGAETLQAAGTLTEPRRRLLTPAQAAGPLRAHTLAVNDAGIAFVQAARERGDECASDSWRHEIAHPIAPARGRRPAELLVADALLTYLQIGKDGALVLHQRFIELDRGTARPAEQLASKITRYARLLHYTGATSPSDTHGQPFWRSYYRSFPHLLIVLADQSRERMHQRIQRTLLLHHSDPAKDHEGTVPVSFVTLDDLAKQGPFAPVFVSAEHPGQPVDWLGQPPPKDR